MRRLVVLVGGLFAGASACAQPRAMPTPRGPEAVSSPSARPSPSAPRVAVPATPFYAGMLDAAATFPIQFHTSTVDCAEDTPCLPATSTAGHCVSEPQPAAPEPRVVVRCTAGDAGFDLSFVETPEGLAFVQGAAPAETTLVVPADLASFAIDEPSGRRAGARDGDRYCTTDVSWGGHERSLELCFARGRGLVLYETSWVSAAGAVVERRAERL